MNEDTVERIVRCIIQNEGGCMLAPRSPPPQLPLAPAFASTDPLFLLPSANAEALKEMLGDSEGEGTMQLSR